MVHFLRPGTRHRMMWLAPRTLLSQHHAWCKMQVKVRCQMIETSPTIDMEIRKGYANFFMMGPECTEVICLASVCSHHCRPDKGAV